MISPFRHRIPSYLTWRRRTITHSPFTPFIILFCHVIETSGASDLEHMRSLVETLESTSSSNPQNTCDKQRRLFKALYDVAAKYVEVKARSDCGEGVVSWPMAWQQYEDGVGLLDGLEGPTALQNAAFGDMDVEIDLPSAELWDWFNKNQSILKMLEDM